MRCPILAIVLLDKHEEENINRAAVRSDAVEEGIDERRIKSISLEFWI